MSAGARLNPRLWDGRRLLRLLTGLSLIALAFASPALATAPAPQAPAVIIITGDPMACAGSRTDRIGAEPAPCAPPPGAEILVEVPETGVGRPDRDVTGPGGVAQRPPAGRAPPLA